MTPGERTCTAALAAEYPADDPADALRRLRFAIGRWTSSVANATKIMWVNGDLDPWHALSNLASPGEEQPVVWPVKGAHHCAWMSAAAEDDQQSIKDARAAVYKQVSEWVGL